MASINIGIVILVVVILLYLFPTTRSCIARSAPWLALVGGGIAVGLLLMTNSDGKVRGGGEQDEYFDIAAEIEELLGDDALDDASDDASDDAPDDAPDDARDDAPESLGAYVVDAPEESTAADE